MKSSAEAPLSKRLERAKLVMDRGRGRFSESNPEESTEALPLVSTLSVWKPWHVPCHQMHADNSYPDGEDFALGK